MPFSLKKANVYVVSGTGCNVTVVEPANLCTNICVGLPCVFLFYFCANEETLILLTFVSSCDVPVPVLIVCSMISIVSLGIVYVAVPADNDNVPDSMVKRFIPLFYHSSVSI